jgi:transcriptional regulator GlxA family with amidase domain
MRKLNLSVALVFLLGALPNEAAVGLPPEAHARRAVITLPAPKAGRAKPVVAVVADEDGAETTDFLIPYGVLKESGAATVFALSTTPEPVQLMSVVKIRADQTLAQFDAAQPAGADIVIVPAQMKPKSKALTSWIRKQVDKGAVLVSICEGARVLAGMGLLDGKRATTHFASLAKFDKMYPRTTWVRDQRWIQDGHVITTTGVSASIPASLAIVEGIAGHDVAQATADRIHAGDWSPRHKTSEFAIEKADYALGMSNLASFWKHETVEAPVKEGVDEIALALQTDAWRRSMRAKVVVAGQAPIRGRYGLTIIPDAPHHADAIVLSPPSGGSARVLDWALAEMTRRYGSQTARLAWLGLEYGREDGAQH